MKANRACNGGWRSRSGRIAGDRMSTNDLAADVASADIYDAYVDVDGCVWVRLPGDAGWSYLADATEISWDVHAVLPAEYEPYRPLDETATAIILGHLQTKEALR
jgi:hypothetical protein